ncbi:Arm DNA-binding domain-containing protein [Caballeronia mineralivorans]|uniref:Arm DNA-binding domain-containing protein n=1 Tax=Caballeronia mineralivorans TaxID=2010198 RepID=UPI003898F786
MTGINIRRAMPNGAAIKLTDSHGFYLEVKPSESKLCRYRFRIDGKGNLFAIDDYPTSISSRRGSAAMKPASWSGRRSTRLVGCRR